MADFAGYYSAASAGLEAQDLNGARLYPSGWASNCKKVPPIWDSVEKGHGPDYLAALGPLMAGVPAQQTPAALTHLDFAGGSARAPQDDFFERIIVLPRKIDAGIVISEKDYTVQVFNSYRREVRTWVNYLNTAGAGIAIPNLPGLPSPTQPLSGYSLTLQILMSGPPSIRGDLRFVFDTITVVLPLTGERTVLLPFEPEAPLEERLRFLTDVRTRQDGTEQRAALRLAPRQIFDVEYVLDGLEREMATVLLHDSISHALGFPVWFEGTTLTAATVPGTATIYVGSTAYADLRVGSLAVILQDSSTYETLQVSSFDATSITFASNLTKTFAAGTRVMPVRVVYASQVVRGDRQPYGLQAIRAHLSSADSDKDLSSTSGFSTYNSKVLLDDPNLVDGTLQETLERELINFDNDTGLFQVMSRWDIGRRGHAKRFFTRTRQRLWEVRCLLHALRGRAVSFYIPTFFPDLTPTAGITAGSSVLTVRNAGYTKFARSRQPLNVVRVTLTTGTVLLRKVTSASEIDSSTEQLQVDAAWGVDATLAQISRVDLVEKVRMDSDEATLTHLDGNGQAVVEVPVKAVLE